MLWLLTPMRFRSHCHARRVSVRGARLDTSRVVCDYYPEYLYGN